jgi:hypothetical protein
MSEEKKDAEFRKELPLPAIHETVLEIATTHPKRFNTPDEHHPEEQIRRINDKYGREEMRQVLAVSKKICEDIIREQNIAAGMRTSAEKILDQAIARQCVDFWQLYVDVTNQQKNEALARVLYLQQRNPSCDVVPVDVSEVMKDVQPITETYIDDLKPIMHVHEHIEDDDLPDEIMIAVPNKDITDNVDESPFSFTQSPDEDLTFDITRYVRIDSMPDELQNVIRRYLRLVRGFETSPVSGDYKTQREVDALSFANFVEKLYIRTRDVVKPEREESDK